MTRSRSRPHPDAPPALRALRAAGCTLIVVSNWDCSLHERLDETGLAPLVDGAVASAELGEAKPARAIFEHALELAGVTRERAWHVGDNLREDVDGARAAGIRAVLLVRDDAAPVAGERPEDSAGADDELVRRPPAPPAGVPVIRSLAELPALIERAASYPVRP